MLRCWYKSTCSCGAKKNEEIPKIEHTFATSKITKEATTTATGVKTYYCSCGATKTEVVPKKQEVRVLHSGKDGSISWALSSDDILTISGTGKMRDYDYDQRENIPWYEYRDQIKSVVIENGKNLARITRKNDSFILTENSWERIQSPEYIKETAIDTVRTLVTQHPDIQRIGITGQMHGIVYLDKDGKAVSPLYTWQDERGNRQYKDGETYVQ